MGVQDTVASLTDDRELILAGLFHSIYGTEGFQAFTVPLQQRPKIRSLIGERAEAICYGELCTASLGADRGSP